MTKNAQGVYHYQDDILDDEKEQIPHTLPHLKSNNYIKYQHKVLAIEQTQNNMIKLTVQDNGGSEKSEATDKSKSSKDLIHPEFDAVITTLPNGNYLNGHEDFNLLANISTPKATAIRKTLYIDAFKAFITFKKQFWLKEGKKQFSEVGGVGASDRPGRQIVYPSYGYFGNAGVLQIYCWADDAKKLGALSSKREQIAECLKMIKFLFPNITDWSDVYDGYDENECEAWFWSHHAGGGAFTLYGPGQFGKDFPILQLPELDNKLYFAGEAASAHNGWIVGALDSAYNSVCQLIKNFFDNEKAKSMLGKIQMIWGKRDIPDILDPDYNPSMEYRFNYSEFDRNSKSSAPGKESPYESDFVFNGDVPAFIAEYKLVPSEMKKTREDLKIADMLNALWDRNVELRNKATPIPVPVKKDAVSLLEHIYYGNNFQAIPKPQFWLKDDDEFARQQLGGFMPNMLELTSLKKLVEQRILSNNEADLMRQKSKNSKFSPKFYIANFAKYLNACTVTPKGCYLPKPVILFEVRDGKHLAVSRIRLEDNGEWFYPEMKNAENAWLLAKMYVNCAGQTLHDVGFHQLYTHQVASLVSISLFSTDMYKSEHSVFKLLKPHVVKALEFQQNVVYNFDYNPNAKTFPMSRKPPQQPGVYNFGFVYDLIFSCGRIGNYQLQDKMWFNDGNFKFLDLAIPKDAKVRGVESTPFSYPYLHDSMLWYNAINDFVKDFVSVEYDNQDSKVAQDSQLQSFFNKLIPAFNNTNHKENLPKDWCRFPKEVKTCAMLIEVLTMFIWQFSVQHTVVNDGAYNHAAFVPNASTLMNPLPKGKSEDWTADDVLAALPNNSFKYKDLGNMNFMDLQINASVTGQGPYQSTFTGRGTTVPEVSWLQSTYNFTTPALINSVDNFYKEIVVIGEKIRARQARDAKDYLNYHPNSNGTIPETVSFSLLLPFNVMTSIVT